MGCDENQMSLNNSFDLQTDLHIFKPYNSYPASDPLKN